MKNKKTIGIVVITLLVATIIYLYRDRLKAMLPQDVNPDDESNPTTEPSPDETGDTGGIDIEGAHTAEGCGGAYNRQLDEISEIDPESNLYGCGSAVVAWQNYLNNAHQQGIYGLGVTIAEDGRYGNATLQKHRLWLENNPISGRDITAPLFEQGSGASLN